MVFDEYLWKFFLLISVTLALWSLKVFSMEKAISFTNLGFFSLWEAPALKIILKHFSLQIIISLTLERVKSVKLI